MTEPIDIRIACIACHHEFEQRFREIPPSGIVDATCPVCFTGWGLDTKLAIYPKPSGQPEIIHAYRPGHEPPTMCGRSSDHHTARWESVNCLDCLVKAPDSEKAKRPALFSGSQPQTEPEQPEPTPSSSTPSRARAEEGWGPVLTRAKVEEICAHIEKALPMDWACHLCDVSPETLTAGRKRHADLEMRIEKARAKGGAALVTTLHTDTTAGRNVTRSTFLLERLYPKQFHLPVVVTGVGGTPVGSDPTDREPPVKRRWMLNFMAEHGRWPNADEHPPGEEPGT